MGCGSSTSHPSPKVSPIPQEAPKDPPIASPIDQGINYSEDFQSIKQGVSRFIKDPTMAPISIFGENTFAIASAPLCLEEGDFVKLTFPVAAFTRTGQGHILVLGGLQPLTDVSEDEQQGNVFLENSIRWCCDTFRREPVLLMHDINEQAADAIKHWLQKVGYHSKLSSDPERILRSSCCLIMSTCTCFNEINSVLSRGGGLIIAAAPPDTPNRFAINSYLRQFGILFTNTPFLIGPLKTKELKLTRSYSEAQKYSFQSFFAKFKQIINDAIPSIPDLDSAISALRYAAEPMDRHAGNHELDELWSVISDTLLNSEPETSEGFCPTIFQQMLTSLLSDIYPKMPAAVFENLDLSTRFPGSVLNFEPATFSIDFPVLVDGYNQTGLYAHPSTMAYVEIPSLADDYQIEVQIGAHTEVLTTRPGPWKRWASIPIRFVLTDTKTEICSPFGGPIYVLGNSSQPISLTFSNVCEYSIYSGNSLPWKPNEDVPIAELAFKNCIFTYLTWDDFQNFDLAKTQPIIENLIQTALTLSDSQSIVRVVFDVEPIFVPGYPITLPTSIIPKIFTTEPSSELFTLVVYAALTQLPDGMFLPDHENLISIVIASCAFEKQWPNCAALDYCTFNVSNGYVVLYPARNAIKAALSRMKKVDDLHGESWQIFIQIMSEITKMNLTSLLPKKSQTGDNPRPPVQSYSSTSLQSFILE